MDLHFEVIKMTVDSVNQFTQQLLTVATAILTLSIAFTKDIVKNPQKSPIWILTLAWAFFLISICFGLLTMQSITEISDTTVLPTQLALTLTDLIQAILKHIRYYTSAQFMSFVIGLILLIIYGAKSLGIAKNKTSK